MSYREREQDEGPDTAYMPCGLCGVVEADHGHVFIRPCGSLEGKDSCWYCAEPEKEHSSHAWEPPSDNSPDEPDED